VNLAEYGIAERPATRTVVVDVDEHPGERQPAVRARDADELLQRHPPFANEAELHDACRRELGVLVDARDQERRLLPWAGNHAIACRRSRRQCLVLPQRASGALGLHVLEVLLAIRRSAAEGAAIGVA
jgi:hypothetical protein